MPQLVLDVSRKIDRRLDEISENMGISKADAVEKAFALLSVAERQMGLGRELGVIGMDAKDRRPYVVSRIVGINAPMQSAETAAEAR